LDDLRQLEDYANGFTNTADFLAELALLGNTETEVAARGADHEGEAVKLSTVHQAKGLEYGTVFVIMLCDGPGPRTSCT
jgi:DNA helicase-2/ATP-dependent DNA helicase PcrA